MNTHDELMARLAGDPEDEQAWAVLQDWLLSEGDVRGKLMTADSRMRTRYLKTRGEKWFGRPVTVQGDTVEVRDGEDAWGPAVIATFERGHVRKLRVDTRWDGQRAGWGAEWMYPAIERLLSQPVGRLVTEIEVRATPYSEFFYEGLVECISEAGPLAVRAFYAGDDDQLSWTNVPDVSTLWAAAPHLLDVKLEGSNIRLGRFAHERLRRLHLISGGLPREPVASLATAGVPALEDLEIWFGDSEYGAECSIEDVRPLLHRSFPALKRMSLSNCEFADELVPAVMEATWLPQIRELAFVESILTDTGAEELLRHADRLEHLEHLDLSDGFLTAGVTARLVERFGDRVECLSQNDPYEYGDDEPMFYVGIGE